MNVRFVLIAVLVWNIGAIASAHEGHDHSGETLVSSAPPSLGSPIYMAKAVQFLMEVRTAPVVEETLPRRLKTLGRIVLPQARQAQVRAPFHGIIVAGDEMPAPEPGSLVTRGEVLALLEQSIEAPQRVSLAAEIASAKAELELAKEDLHHTGIELKRVESLGEAASDRRLVETRAENTHARLRMDGLERQLTALRAGQSAAAANPRLVPLFAPISGTVATAEVTQGEYVGPETLLFEIVDTDLVWAVADVYEQDLPVVENASRAVVRSESYDVRFEAAIHHVSPRLDPDTRTARAVFEVPNPERQLRDGMFVTVHIETADEETGLMIPKEAVTDQNGLTIAYVKTGAESFVAREVRVAGTWGDRYMIKEGLLPNEIVVTQGIYQVRASAVAGGAPQPQEESSLEHGHEH